MYKQGQRNAVRKFGHQLNDKLPKAEKWFQSKWKEHKMLLLIGGMQDRFNYPFGVYIPDVINHTFKYIIEIDEPHHQEYEQQLKDKEKDEFYTKFGYTVVRINAYSEEDYIQCVKKIKQVRIEFTKKFPNYRIPQKISKIWYDE